MANGAGRVEFGGKTLLVRSAPPACVPLHSVWRETPSQEISRVLREGVVELGSWLRGDRHWGSLSVGYEHCRGCNNLFSLDRVCPCREVEGDLVSR